MLPGVRAVLTYFAGRQQPDGLLANVGWWNFVDWAAAWPNGVPPAGARGESAPLDLQLLLAYQAAADLEGSLGTPAQAGAYRDAAERLTCGHSQAHVLEARSTASAPVDGDAPAGGVFADVADGSRLSQHAQALAILAGVPTPAEMGPLATRMLSDAFAGPGLHLLQVLRPPGRDSRRTRRSLPGTARRVAAHARPRAHDVGREGRADAFRRARVGRQSQRRVPAHHPRRRLGGAQASVAWRSRRTSAN